MDYNVLAYEAVIKRFAAEGIAYEVKETTGNFVTFRLSKNGFGAITTMRFSDEDTHDEQSNGYAITAFLNFVAWNEQEQERKRKKEQRGKRG